VRACVRVCVCVCVRAFIGAYTGTEDLRQVPFSHLVLLHANSVTLLLHLPVDLLLLLVLLFAPSSSDTFPNPSLGNRDLLGASKWW
jgi:hypothetical protein